jgi:hypothetical protein
MVTKEWAMFAPTEGEVQAAQALKEPYVGNDKEGPSSLPPNAFKMPGPTKRDQEKWTSFIYVPPPSFIDMRSWKFETYGLVENPLSLSYSEFKELPTNHSLQDHTCVDYITTEGHDFEGVTWQTILDLTKPSPECKWVLMECDGGHTMSTSILQDIILVYIRNGEPINPTHGYPLRAWTPGEWGFKNVKWLKRIKFCEEREVDYWTAWMLLKGIDPDGLAGGYDSNVGSGLDIETLDNLNTHTYHEFLRERREHLHTLGGRLWGFSQARAPMYIGDDTWGPEDYQYGNVDRSGGGR